MQKALHIIILVLFGTVALSGCVEEGFGVLVLKITDAPSELNLSRAVVTISNIDVHLMGLGWITIVEDPQVFDLIQLQDATEFLGNATLFAGHYTQIRLYIEHAQVTIDGVNHTLKIPSEKINLIHPFQIVANETTTLTLDFLAQESIHATGQGKYIMRPTIKIIQE